MKNQDIRGDCLKRGAWTVCRVKGWAWQKKSGIDTPMHIMRGRKNISFFILFFLQVIVCNLLVSALPILSNVTLENKCLSGHAELILCLVVAHKASDLFMSKLVLEAFFRALLKSSCFQQIFLHFSVCSSFI